MWVHPDIIQSQQWTDGARRKSIGKAEASHCNVVSISSREAEMSVASLTDSEEKESAFANQDVPPCQELGPANST